MARFLRAQLQLWEAIHSGFLPMLLQHRGGQLPVQEPSSNIQGFVWREIRLQLRCFKVNDDARTFLELVLRGSTACLVT